MIVEQNSFDAGINLLTSDMQISERGYRWLINARQRLGFIEANKKNVEQEDAPAGKKQGHIGVGNVHILFVAGSAYYKIDGDVGWIKIPGFTMDAIADRYYTCAVPASSFNFVRKNDGVSANNPIIVDVDFAINGLPAGIIVQDNVTQPHIIFYDSVYGTFIARPTKTYSEWTITDHEYVPIGKQMIHKNGVTIIVARDGKSFYRSVTGRPLDFVVIVDTDGNKLPTEYNGGAARSGVAFDFDDITCLMDSNAQDVFILASARNIRLIAFDYTRTIFGEPRFNEAAIIEAGVVNQESLVEVLGDYAFVDFENIKSFNATMQIKNEGNNSIFSLQLASLLNGVKQKEPCACVFNNYALFYVKTVWGNLIAVYDELHEKWVAFDLTVVDRIKQFAFVETVTATKLYAITHHDELFQMYSSDERELAQLMTRSIVPLADIQHKAQSLKPLFHGGNLEGEIALIEFVDDKESQRLTNELDDVSSGVAYPVRPPIIPSTASSMDENAFVLKDGLLGKKLSYIIQWQTNARLHGFTLRTSEVQRDAPLKQQAKTIKNTYEA